MDSSVHGPGQSDHGLQGRARGDRLATTHSSRSVGGCRACGSGLKGHEQALQALERLRASRLRHVQCLPARWVLPCSYINSYIGNDVLCICGICMRPAESSALPPSGECTFTGRRKPPSVAAHGVAVGGMRARRTPKSTAPPCALQWASSEVPDIDYPRFSCP